ncbi:MAG: ASCH domain-containing protein [Acidimicrobiia bacterium]
MSIVETFWDRFVAAIGLDGPYDAWGFGDESMPETMTELALLVRDGPKRATTGVLAEYEDEGEPIDEVGRFTVILGGGGEPVCVTRNTSVEVRRFGDVDDEFARTEGEGDGSLEYWRSSHQEYFANAGYPVDDDTLMVLVTFELVWDGRN